jgi:RNA polymerase sigma factor (sigma-70 family)
MHTRQKTMMNANLLTTSSSAQLPLEERLHLARPCLARLLLRWGVAPDAVDDLVQETLITAWQHLDRVYTPEVFDAWLAGICRNLCFRWKRSHSRAVLHEISLSDLAREEAFESEEPAEQDILDPMLLDPFEELSRQELARLLERALEHLPASARTVLELCYLAEIPQQEAAAHLGIAKNTLEVRLHRARRRLCEVLSRKLRSEAEDFGLALPDEATATWQETRIWCILCAGAHLQGRFETLPDGRVNVHLHCPRCHASRHTWIHTGGWHELRGLRSYRSAWKRGNQLNVPYWTAEQQRRLCFSCGSPVQTYLIGPGETPDWLQPWQGLRFIKECPVCRLQDSFYIGSSVWFHPATQLFTQQHPRWLQEPEVTAAYHGFPSFRIRLRDRSSSDRLTVWLHRETLQTLASVQE